jgi:hypothetical protein
MIITVNLRALLLLKISLLILTSTIYGQDYINLTIPQYYQGKDLVLTDTGMVIVFHTFLSTGQESFSLQEMSFSGNLGRSYEWDPSPWADEFIIEETSVLCKDDYGNYVVVGTHVFDGQTQPSIGRIIIVKSDLSDTLYTRSFKADSLSRITAIQGISRNSKGYLLNGFTYHDSSQFSQGFISQLDTSFETQWTKLLDQEDTTGWGDRVKTVFEGPDGCIAYGKVIRRKIFSGPITGDLSFGIIDSNLNVIHHEQIGGFYYDDYPFLSVLKDSSIVLSYSKGELSYPFPNDPDPISTHWLTHVSYRNWDGSEYKHGSYGRAGPDSCQNHPASQRYFLSMGNITVGDDSIYVYGHNNRQSQLMLIDPVNDSLWLRDLSDDENYYLDTCFNYNKEGTRLWKVVERNGWLFGTGMYWNIQGAQKSWVLSFDLSGCNEPNCDLGTTQELNTRFSFNVELYPIPATSFLQIDLRKELQEGKIEIYSMMGELINHYRVPTSEIELDISDLSKGSYVIIIKDGNTVVGREVVVKE